jgi:hypothetical protein
MTDTIKPPWAFSVWSNSDHIFAELPAINGHQAHQVKVPNDVMGLRKLLILAKSRHVESKVGTKGDPTQHQINKPMYGLVRRVGRIKTQFTPQQRIGAREILRKMGLI